MIFIYIILGLLLVILAVTLFNFFTAPMLEKGLIVQSDLKVSLLIPVRNEEKNINRCLTSVLKQSHSNLEICILDDHSEDNTASIVSDFAQSDKRVKLISGKPLPAEWTGKNWACHQLAHQATGDIIIFTDADNQLSADAVNHTLGWMQKLNLDFLSAFPQQHYSSFWERLIAPSVYMTVYAYLPLWMTYYSKQPSLAAANGQWLALTKQAYNKIGGHESVKKEIVEDTALSRKAKSEGLKLITLSGRHDVTGFMYQGFKDVFSGFSKNLYGLTGYQILPFLFLLFVMISGTIVPYFLLFTDVFFWGFSLVLINLLIKSLIAFKYREPFLESVLLHPLAILITVIVALNSLHWYLRGWFYWKDRKVYYAK